MSGEFESKPFPCHNNRIASGHDSRVYLEGDVVIKEYYRDLNEREYLELYYEITNRGAELSEGGKTVLDLPFSRQRLPLKINPFIEMRTCVHCSRIEGVAQFISGDRLDQSLNFDQKELSVALKNMSHNLNDMLGVTGINIIPLNIKDIGNGILVVTDLCSGIIDLRRKENV